MLDGLGRALGLLWAGIGVLLLGLLVIEFGIGWWRRLSRLLRYRAAERPDIAALSEAHAGGDWTIGYFDEYRRHARVDWRAHVGWWQRPFRGRYLTFDARGLRPTPGEDDPDPRAVRICCFGGSALMGVGARDHATIPALLARRLGALGHRAAIVNYGQLSHNSTQETITLQRLLAAGTRIDIAVFYDGINEMICAEQSGRADALFNEAYRRAEFNLMHPERRADLFAAALLAALPRTLRRLRRLLRRPLRGPFPPPYADLTRVDIPALADRVVAGYVANLRLVRALAAEYRFRPVFFWMPVITTKRQKTADEQRMERDYTRQPEERRALWGAIVEARRRHPALAGTPDIVDLSALFDDRAEPVYIDLYHLGEVGNAAVAEAMLPAIAAFVAMRGTSGAAVTRE